MNKTLGILMATVVLGPWTASAQTVVPSRNKALAPLAGPQYTAPPLQSWIGFYGTDLGFTMQHEGQLRILFGDTWAAALLPSIGPFGDDSQGTICLQAWGCPLGGTPLATGSAVEAYTGTSGNFWTHPGPPLVLRRNALGRVAPQAVYAGGGFGSTLLDMGPLRTPVAVFSNGMPGAASGAFAIFIRAEAVPCATGCASGFMCDRNGLGVNAGVPCLLGETGCAPTPEGGICVDDTSPRHDDASAAGRLRGSVLRMRIGNADRTIQEQYYTQAWDTHKFANPSAVTVESYDLTQPAGHDRVGAGTVANPAPASGAAVGTEKVFLWGRPGFIGSHAYPANLYFAVASVPSYSGIGSFTWQPWFYAGKDTAGRPTFSDLEREAEPVELEGSTMETFDIVNQHSVRYISALQKWVILYGGDLDPALWETGTGVTRDPKGAIQIRFADVPWGPWSPPQALLLGGDPSVGGDQYAPGGILHHGACAPGSQCVPGELMWMLGFLRDEPGYLYGANLIPEWTVNRLTEVDLYWNVSTWSPYQVVLMRSTIQKP